MDPADFAAKMDEMNRHLRDLSPVMEGIRGELKTLNHNLKYMRGLTKQMYIFNQILTSVGKVSGGVGVVQALVTSMAKFIQRSG
jgi:hypothetical protein